MELKISNNDTSKRYLSIRRTVMALEVVESRSDDETTGSSNSTDNFCATRVNPVYEETREDADVDDEFGWDDEVMSPILESAPVPASDKQISDSIPEEGAESFEGQNLAQGLKVLRSRQSPNLVRKKEGLKTVKIMCPRPQATMMISMLPQSSLFPVLATTTRMTSLVKTPVGMTEMLVFSILLHLEIFTNGMMPLKHCETILPLSTPISFTSHCITGHRSR